MADKFQINQKNFQQLLNKEYFSPSYLDKFLLNKGCPLPKVTAIVPTFNRSPHPPEEDSNPLGWCLESLLVQKNGGLDEIIIVNDASTDYTEEIIKGFQEKASLPIIYLKNKKNLGSSISRNIAVKQSKNNLVMFVDDDCVFSKYMFFGANYTLNKLDKNVVALHLPVYHRKTVPHPVSIKDIGILNLEEGDIIKGNFDGFPIEYINDLKNNLLNNNPKIIKPIEIKNLAGIFLIKKEIFEEIGGFPEFFTWKNGYREETDIALKLSENNYKMFFTPDPKFYCVHLKYGAAGEMKEECLKESRLKRLVAESNIPRIKTGNRVDTEEWFFDYIISTYITIGRRDPKAAREYINKVKKSFVEENELSMAGVGRKINDPRKRQYIFNKALSKGSKLTKK